MRHPATRSPILMLALLGIALAAPGGAAELTVKLVEARLDVLRADDTGNSDDVIKAYDTARDWLTAAATSDRDAAQYVGALTSAPEREAEIQARMDALDATADEVKAVEGLAPEDLKAQLTLSRAELRDATNSLDALEQRLAGRETVASQIQTRLQEITTRIGEIASVEVPIEPNQPPSLAEALQWGAMAERIASVAERRAGEARLASQPVRFSARRAERAELALRIERLNAKRHALEAAARNVIPVEESEAPAIPVDDPAHAIVAEITAGSSVLRERTLELEALLDAARANLERIEATTRALGERFSTARRVVEFASDSDVLGNLLLAYWQDVGTLQLADPTHNIPQQVGDTVISRIEHEQALAEIASTSSYVNRRIEAAGLAPEAISDEAQKALGELARSRREILRRVIVLESNLIGALSDVDAGYARLSELTDEYALYLRGLILWVPSQPVLWKSDFRGIPTEARRLTATLGELRVDVRPSFIVVILIAGILAYTRPRLQQAQHAQNPRLGKARQDGILLTVGALLSTALRAMPAPLLVLAIGMLIADDSSAAATALSKTISGLVSVLFVLTSARIICEESGVGRSHFGWSAKTCDRVRGEAGWLRRWWVPVATLASVLFRLGEDTALLGRLALLASLLLLLAHLGWQVQAQRQSHRRRWLSNPATQVRLALIAALPLVLAGVVAGVHYSTSVIAGRLLTTAWVGYALVILYNVLTRWLRVVRRRLRLAELLAARAARQEEQSPGESPAVEEDQPDLVDLGAETTQLLNAATVAGAVAALLYIWMPLLPALDALSGVNLWSSTSMVAGESVTTQITLATLLFVIFLLGVTFFAARKLPALVELVLRSRTEMSASGRYTASALLNYVIIGVGLVAALSSLGLQWSQLQWLVAALSVGIGFGLQEIIANFISGLIILFERPIRVGDTITVGGQDGTVTKIRIRATTIRDWDGKELLVPNKEFITTQLLNWTLSDPKVRMVVPVGIAYGSDVERALRIMEEIADEDPNIIEEPAPSVIFSGFGDNSLELKLRFFVESMENRWAITTGVLRRINELFGEAGIVIAFPQRDVHLHSAKPIRVTIDPPAMN